VSLPVDHHRRPLPVFVVAGIAALAGLLFGYDTGIISGAILFIRTDFALSATTEGLVVSAVLFGATFSSVLSGRLADRLGRRTVLLIASLFFIVGSLVGAFATSVVVLVISRFVLGLAIGVASFTAPLYISEIAPPNVRGRLVGLNQLAITLGILLSYVVDFSFAKSRQWDWMIGLGAVPGLLLALGMFFLPESPRWLLLRGQSEKARVVLQEVRGQSDVSAEWTEIQETLKGEQGAWRELLKPWFRPMLIVGVGLAFFQQFTGINTVIYYAPTIFKLAGFHSDSTSILATIGVGLVNAGMTVVAISLMDRVGRRPLLLTGLVGMALSLFALTLGFAGVFGRDELKWIGVLSLMAYVASFAISIGPIFWLMISEIYPLRLRGLAMSLATGACWVCNLIVTFTFLLLIQSLGPAGTFGLLGVITLAAIVFSYFLVPETKGRSLEQIEHDVRVTK
jgi:SP family galactose:H+ symporter-like MFS transporter